MLKGIDLHIHSTYSDGSWSINQILKESLKKRIPAISLTDHDTTKGVTPLQELSKDKNITIIPGIELSTKLGSLDIHILGYYPNMNSLSFNDGLANIQEERFHRNKKMISLLQENGVDITYEKLTSEYPSHILTRAQFGAYLTKHGYCHSIRDAFKKYIGTDCPCYLPRKCMSVKEGVRFLKDANALVFIAHPGLYKIDDDDFINLVKELVPIGLDGIECYHSSHLDTEIEKYRTIAKNFNLLTSGGSDFHGENKPGIALGVGHGELYVPYHLLELMQARIAHTI